MQSNLTMYTGSSTHADSDDSERLAPHPLASAASLRPACSSGACAVHDPIRCLDGAAPSGGTRVDDSDSVQPLALARVHGSG